MGLTSFSTGNALSGNNSNILKENPDFTVALSGNPNVRKIKYIE